MKRTIQQAAVLSAWAAGMGLVWLTLRILGSSRSPAWTQNLFMDEVYATAYLFAGGWVFGSAQLLWLQPSQWLRSQRLDAAALTMWAGLLMLACHIVAAYQRLGTHVAVVEHTARTAGVGWGVYVNYLFATVWLADTLWLGAATASYARRQRWVGRAVHGFLAFIVFNATVVYGEPATRLAGAGWFSILGFSWFRRARYCVPFGSGLSPGEAERPPPRKQDGTQ